MTFDADIQRLVDNIRAYLGIPPCKLTINMDDRGAVQTIQPLVTYTRPKGIDKSP